MNFLSIMVVLVLAQTGPEQKDRNSVAKRGLPTEIQEVVVSAWAAIRASNVVIEAPRSVHLHAVVPHKKLALIFIETDGPSWL
jgi:hypothetical protein